MSGPIWKDPVWVGRTPILTACLLDGGAIGQIVRMWREQTAAGQSLTSWCAVVAALCLWLNFYRVITPDQKWAIRVQALSIAINIAIVATIVWFRYVVSA
jgi:hypothetical protein